MLSAYEETGINLIAAPLPLKDLGQIKAFYPDPRLDDPDFRNDMGIGEGTEWPVALAGYVVNAFDQPAEDISGDGHRPFQPVEGDEYFHSRRGTPQSSRSNGSGSNPSGGSKPK